MYLFRMENSRLKALVAAWKSSESIPQEAFDWTRSRANWQRDIPQHSDFIAHLPNEIDRSFLRSLINQDNFSIMEKFLTVMIWGYGDLGYGSFRVNKMFSSLGAEEKISLVYDFCQNRQPLSAYDYLAKNRVTQLGPAFGTKLISFFTPREVAAPIYDSFIWKWMSRYANDAFENGSCSSEVWNLKIYTTYLNWMSFHASRLNCYSDDLELVIFRDSLDQFSSTSSWTGQ